MYNRQQAYKDMSGWWTVQGPVLIRQDIKFRISVGGPIPTLPPTSQPIMLD